VISSSNSLLDTNVLSEYQRRRPDSGVIEFLGQLGFQSTFLSVVTLSEIRFGIERLPRGTRRERFDHWLSWELPLEFRDRILPVSEAVAETAGLIRASAMDTGRPMAVMDALIAASAQVHGLTLITRNVKDFAAWGGPILNPWKVV